MSLNASDGILEALKETYPWVDFSEYSMITETESGKDNSEKSEEGLERSIRNFKDGKVFRGWNELPPEMKAEVCSYLITEKQPLADETRKRSRRVLSSFSEFPLFAFPHHIRYTAHQWNVIGNPGIAVSTPDEYRTLTRILHHQRADIVFSTRTNKITQDTTVDTRPLSERRINDSDDSVPQKNTVFVLLNRLERQLEPLEELTREIKALQGLGRLKHLTIEIDQGLSPLQPLENLTTKATDFYRRTRSALDLPTAEKFYMFGSSTYRRLQHYHTVYARCEDSTDKSGCGESFGKAYNQGLHDDAGIEVIPAALQQEMSKWSNDQCMDWVLEKSLAQLWDIMATR